MAATQSADDKTRLLAQENLQTLKTWLQSSARISAGLNSSLAIPMTKDGGTYFVPVRINGTITLEFAVDSGASDVTIPDVTIPQDVVITLIRAKTIREEDFIGEQVYVLADGTKAKSLRFRIRSLQVGDRVLENVTGSVASTKGAIDWPS